MLNGEACSVLSESAFLSEVTFGSHIFIWYDWAANDGLETHSLSSHMLEKHPLFLQTCVFKCN